MSTSRSLMDNSSVDLGAQYISCNSHYQNEHEK